LREVEGLGSGGRSGSGTPVGFVSSLRGCERESVVGWVRHLLPRLLHKDLASNIWSPTIQHGDNQLGRFNTTI